MRLSSTPSEPETTNGQMPWALFSNPLVRDFSVPSFS